MTRQFAKVSTIVGMTGVLLAAGVAQAAQAAPARPHLSGVVAVRPPARPSRLAPSPLAAPISCSTPGGGNFKTNCNSTGRAVNETTNWVNPVPNGTPRYVAGANDYNSYNGQPQDGYYWSNDGTTWTDQGPIDVFPHATQNFAGDPRVYFDRQGRVFYASLLTSRANCNAGTNGTETVGGMELLRQQNPPLGPFEQVQIAANTATLFEDKEDLAVSGENAFVSWTQFRFSACNGTQLSSPIMLARVPRSGTLAVASTLPVPGSVQSQGSAIARDGRGGVWLAWEEFPGGIKLIHYSLSANSFDSAQTVSPATFQPLPSPLPGFRFRDNSFPVITVTGEGCAAPSVAGCPHVAWTSYDGGVGRAWLWNQNNGPRKVSDSGGNQFFPAIAPGGPGRSVFVSFSQANPLDSANTANNSYDRWVAHDGRSEKVSTASSFPNRETFFGGTFIGDYEGMTVFAPATGPATWLPIWTDIRNVGGAYPMNAVIGPRTLTP